MTIDVREKSGVRVWFYDFTLNRKRYRGWLLPFENMSKRQAVAEVRRIRAEILTDTSPITRRNGKETSIASVLSDYESYLKENKPETYNRISYFFNKLKFFANLPEITSADIRSYQRKRLSDGVSGATINRELESARSAFNRAIRLNKWKSLNPFANFDHFFEEGRTRYLTEDELARLLYAAKLATCDKKSPYTHDIILLAITMGRRKQEILRLHISNIDFDNGLIVKKASGTVKGRRDEYTPIPDAAMPILKRRATATRSGYLFENPQTGKPVTDIKKSFHTALRIAGISNFRFHDLRHTFATYALLATRDIRCVQEVIGHANIAMTSRYAHVIDDKKREAINATGKLLSTAMDKKVDEELLKGRKSTTGY